MVSRQWRAISFQSPELWTGLKVDQSIQAITAQGLPTPVSRERRTVLCVHTAKRILLWLRRSGGSLPLNLMAPTPVKVHTSHLGNLALDSPENPFKVPALPNMRERPAPMQIEAHISTSGEGEHPPRPPTRQANRSPDASMTSHGSISTLVADTSTETTHSFMRPARQLRT